MALYALIAFLLVAGVTFLVCWGALRLYRRSGVLQVAGDLTLRALLLAVVTGFIVYWADGEKMVMMDSAPMPAGALWGGVAFGILMSLIVAFVLCVWAWRAAVYVAARLAIAVERKRDELRETEQSLQNQLEMQKQDALRRWQEEHASPIEGEQRNYASRGEVPEK